MPTLQYTPTSTKRASRTEKYAAHSTYVMSHTPVPEVLRTYSVGTNGILVLSGYGLRVAIEHGQLVVADGVGRDRRAGAFSRATCGLKRLVVLGHSGTISFEALRWLHDVGVAVVQIDADGNVLVASAPLGYDDARLRRAQALAAFTDVGLAITRGLLGDKLAGQAQALGQFARCTGTEERQHDLAQAQTQIQEALQHLEHADTLEQLRLLESQAAGVYWNAWSAIEVRFAKRDQARVPAHWRTFGTRRSPVSGASRNAANPANALLNYLYAILEAEAAIAARTVGLDPGIGLLHADQRNRDSLACDLMEAVRPQVDAAVLELLLTHTFGVRDFFENRQGVCRLLPPLTQLLAESAPQWAKAIAPVAEHMAKTLMQSGEQSGRTLPTPLTQRNRSTGRMSPRRSPMQERAPSPSPAEPVVPPACLGCGALLADPKRQYCDTCLPERRAELLPTFSATGPATLSTRRADANDPAHGGKAGDKRSQRVTQHWQEWREASLSGRTSMGTDGKMPDFVLDILPRIANCSLAVLMEATGLSRRYCWLIKIGQKVPHPRHWQTLSALSDALATDRRRLFAPKPSRD
jgi:CRISPR-associated endonuclease Cas1